MIHIFYHNADLDGQASGAICKYAMPDAVLHGINYGDEFPWQEIGIEDTVYMVDFSLQPFSEMIKLRNTCGRFVWIDHHISAIQDAAKHDYAIYDAALNTEYAACELCWEWFNSLVKPTPLPLAVHWLGRYDIWKHKEVPGSLEFQYGMRLYDTNPENQEFWKILFSNLDNRVEEIREQGRILLKYESMQNEKFAQAFSFERKWEGLRCIVVNKGFSNSLVFDSVYDPKKHDVMVSFSYRGGKWHTSLYSTKEEVDVSVIAKKYGGGGHAGAAGFQSDRPLIL